MKTYILLTSLVLVLVGCDSSAKKASRKTLKICFHEFPMTADPRKNADPYSSSLIFMTYEGLTGLDINGNVILSAAESVDISDDMKTFVFHLRETRWSNGSFVTAHDFEYAWKKALDPHFPTKSAALFFPILNAQAAKKGEVSLEEIGVKALDNWTLLVQLEQPTPYFLNLISFATFFPVPNAIDEKNNHWDLSSDLISNGPFSIDKISGRQEIQLKSNPYYWNKNQIHLKKISIEVLQDENLALNLFQKGELNFIGGLTSSFSLDAIPTLKRDPRFVVQPIASTVFITYNNLDPIFSNLNMRKAFAYILNREILVEHVTELNEEIATGLIPPILKKGSKFKTDFFTQCNAECAKEYFLKGCQELGLDPSKFPTIHFPHLKSELYLKLAQTLQEQWREYLGIKVVLEPVDMKILLDRLGKKDYQMALFLFVAQYDDPMNIFERFLDSDNQRNYPSWMNPEYNRLIAESCRTANPRLRAEIMDEAERVFIEDLPIAPLFHMKLAYLIDPRLKNVSLTPTRNININWAFLDVESK